MSAIAVNRSTVEGKTVVKAACRFCEPGSAPLYVCPEHTSDLGTAAEEIDAALPGTGTGLARCNAFSHYVRCRDEGTGHKLALMFALQAPPMSNSDREFLEGSCNGNEFAGGPMAEYIGNELKRVAESYGQNVKGKKYLSQLANFPGDPEAWVSGRGDVQRVLERRGWGSTGSVNVKPVPMLEEPGPFRVADDLVLERVEKKLDENPGLAHANLNELTEATREELTPAWAK